MKPLYLFLASEFFSYKEDNANKREKFVNAWHSIIRLDRNQLGRKSCTIHESYVQWVIDRANQLKMPCPLQRFVTATIPTIPLPLPPKTIEESQKRMTELTYENVVLVGKYKEKERENDTLMSLLEQQTWEILEKD